MKFQVVTCIAFVFLGTALSVPVKISYDRRVPVDGIYDGMNQQYGEPGNYGRIIQQDINADDYDGRTQQGLAFNSDTEAKAQSE